MRVEGLGLRVEGLGLRVEGLGFRGGGASGCKSSVSASVQARHMRTCVILKP